jgi:hypothetical protein
VAGDTVRNTQEEQAMPDAPPTKETLLDAIAAERRFWDALVAAVARAGLLERHSAAGGPSPSAATFRDLAAHLNAWRAWTLARLEAVRSRTGPPIPPWPAGLAEDTPAGGDAINAWFAARDRGRPLAAVLAEATAQLDAIAAVVATTPADDLLTSSRVAWLGDVSAGPAVLGGSFGHLHVDHGPSLLAWLRRETGSEALLPPAPPLFGARG